MKFFLDENFPKSASDLLTQHSHSVKDVRGTSAEGADDATIFELALADKAVFLTTDRDFFHTIPHLYERHYGIVVIALRQPNRLNILSKLEWFLELYRDSNLENKVFQLRDNSFVTYP